MAVIVFLCLVLTVLCAMQRVGAVNVFSLCGTGTILMKYMYVKKTESLTLEMNDGWRLGQTYCTVRVTGDHSGDMLYYKFNNFSLADKTVTVKLSLRSNKGYSSQKFFSRGNHPRTTRQKGYHDIVITVRRSSFTSSNTGLSASLTVYNEGRSSKSFLPTGSIVGIVAGAIVCILLLIVVIVYRTKTLRKRQAQAAVLRSRPSTSTVVTYSHTSATPPGVYPLQMYNPPAYQQRGIPTVYQAQMPSQFAYQPPPSGVLPAYSIPTGPPPAYQPPSGPFVKPSAPALNPS